MAATTVPMRTHALYATSYILDEYGRVYSAYKRAYLQLYNNKNGFDSCIIYINGKQKNILIHLEVWKAFNGALPPGGIKHKDSNKRNNRLSNLIARHPGWQYVEYVKQGISITKIAAYYQLPKKEISKWVSTLFPGGIRKLRQKYPLNKSIDVRK